jgi:hypothetical protein
MNSKRSSRIVRWLGMSSGIVALLAVMFGVLAFTGAAPAEARHHHSSWTAYTGSTTSSGSSSVSTSSGRSFVTGPSLGVGCSAKSINGVTTASLKITVKNGTGDTLNHTGLGAGSTAITTSPQVVNLDVPASGTYTIELVDGGANVVKTAIATVTFSTYGVRCSVRVS